MSFPIVCLDGDKLDIPLDSTTVLAELVSIIDRALVSSGQRVVEVFGDNLDLFNYVDFHRPCTEFSSLVLKSGNIPAPDKLKLAVVTLSIGEKYDSMKAVSEPTFKAYADKVGADFICIDNFSWNMARPHFEKWQMFAYLFEYDRILFLDGDMLVTPDCPDLFAMLPYDRVCGFFEDEVASRENMIVQAQKELGDINWTKGYLNSGMGLYSWIHRPLFKKAVGKYIVAPAGEQSEYNYRLVKAGFKTCRLPHYFNHMDMSGTDFSKSYIIHYAGNGFMKNISKDQLYDAKVELMKKDWESLKDRISEEFKPPPLMLIDGQQQSQLRPFNSAQYIKGPGCIETDEIDNGTLTLLPLTINKAFEDFYVKDTPMGDLLFAIPVARQTGMRLYIPPTFVGQLIYDLLEDDIEVTREITTKTRVCPIVSQLLGEKEASFHVRKWGAPSIAEGFGKVNVTESIGAALGIRIKDPQFRLKRPAAEVSGRVIIFPTGSTPQRSLKESYTSELQNYLKFKGYEVLLGDQYFENPQAYGEFVASAEYVVSVATGPQHLAAAMGIKTVGLCIASSDWGYCAKGEHVKLLKTSCSDCWYQSADKWLCGEELPLCMREHNAMDVFLAMKELDKAGLALIS